MRNHTFQYKVTTIKNTCGNLVLLFSCNPVNLIILCLQNRQMCEYEDKLL